MASTDTQNEVEGKSTVDICEQQPSPHAIEERPGKTNPKSWPLHKKLFHSLVPVVLAFEVYALIILLPPPIDANSNPCNSTFSTSVTVPAASILEEIFSVSRTISLLPLSLYTLGLAFGPLLTAPCSEIFGRRPIYIATFGCLLLFTGVGTASSNFAGLLICRFLAGFLGSAAMSIGAGSAADIWDLRKAGGSVGLMFITGPFLGPILGPVAGRYILESHGEDWRWTQWLIIFIGAPAWIAALLMEETRRHPSSTSPQNAAEESESAAHIAATRIKDKIIASVIRSVHLLFCDIIVLSLSVYSAFAYAVTFSYFASIPYVAAEIYGLSPKHTSLLYISILIGYLLAILMFVYFDKTKYARAKMSRGAQCRPLRIGCIRL